MPSPTRTALVLAALLALPACAPTPRAVREPPNADQATEARVKAALGQTLGIGAAAVGVQAAGGAVTLNGFVENDAERRRALDAARGVAGVTRVQDRIEVK